MAGGGGGGGADGIEEVEARDAQNTLPCSEGPLQQSYPAPRAPSAKVESLVRTRQGRNHPRVPCAVSWE